MIAEIIAVGSEMLTPYRQDTNSLFLTRAAQRIGRHRRLQDRRRRQLRPPHWSCSRRAIDRSDIVIFIGGLGPTEDDLTRECVAAALGVDLRRDHDIVAAMYKRFAERRISMPPNNAKQADVIEGAIGAAQFARHRSRPISGDRSRRRAAHHHPASRPSARTRGALEERMCMPRLRECLPPAAIATNVLKTAMLPESAADARTAPIYKKYPNVETTVLAGQGQVEFHLRATARTIDEAQAAVDKLAGELEDELDDAVFSTRGESLEEIVGYFLQMRNLKLAVAESCTGGMVV